MKLVISHIFNEEYMLPMWLEHHKNIFDKGIIIDYRSTDRSVEICREIVPHWDIVTTENEFFTGILCDFEVMKYEQQYPDAWKIALNVTEFLVGNHLDAVLNWLSTNDKVAGIIPAGIMVDDELDKPLIPGVPLVQQKHRGFWEADFPFEEMGFWWMRVPLRARIMHNYKIGAYTPGRHGSDLPKQHKVDRKHMAIFWYAYSPWNKEFITRKDQIKQNVDPQDKNLGFGRQHLANDDEFAERRKSLLPFCKDLYLDMLP